MGVPVYMTGLNIRRKSTPNGRPSPERVNDPNTKCLSVNNFRQNKVVKPSLLYNMFIHAIALSLLPFKHDNYDPKQAVYKGRGGLKCDQIKFYIPVRSSI